MLKSVLLSAFTLLAAQGCVTTSEATSTEQNLGTPTARIVYGSVNNGVQPRYGDGWCKVDVDYALVEMDGANAVMDSINEALGGKPTEQSLLEGLDCVGNAYSITGTTVFTLNEAGLASAYKKGLAGPSEAEREYFETYTFDLRTGVQLRPRDFLSDEGLAVLRAACQEWTPTELRSDTTRCDYSGQAVFTLEPGGIKLRNLGRSLIDGALLIPWDDLEGMITHDQVARLASY